MKGTPCVSLPAGVVWVGTSVAPPEAVWCSGWPGHFQVRYIGQIPAPPVPAVQLWAQSCASPPWPPCLSAAVLSSRLWQQSLSVVITVLPPHSVSPSPVQFLRLYRIVSVARLVKGWGFGSSKAIVLFFFLIRKVYSGFSPSPRQMRGPKPRVFKSLVHAV